MYIYTYIHEYTYICIYMYLFIFIYTFRHILHAYLLTLTRANLSPRESIGHLPMPSTYRVCLKIGDFM